MNVSPGSIIKHNERISTHDCTTFAGYSGGPVVSIESPGVFIGHHIAGSNAPTPTENLYLSATHPEYVRDYIKHVLPGLLEEVKTKSIVLSEIQQNHLLKWLNRNFDVPKTDLLAAMEKALSNHT